VFAKIFAALRPGGSFWIADLVEQHDARLQSLVWERYGEYLFGLGGTEYRDTRFLAYVAKEDTPRSVIFQLDLLRSVRLRDGRHPAQERLLCGLRRDQRKRTPDGRGLVRPRPSGVLHYAGLATAVKRRTSSSREPIARTAILAVAIASRRTARSIVLVAEYRLHLALASIALDLQA